MAGDPAKNKRTNVRFAVAMDVRVTTSDGRNCLMKTRNVSDSGAFLENRDIPHPPAGTVITIQIVDKLAEGEAPQVRAEVMHVNEDGFGVRFVD